MSKSPDIGTFEQAEAAEREAIERFRAQQSAQQQQAQALHAKLLEFPATFAPSLYLADAAGMVRVIFYEPGAGGDPIVRTSTIMPSESFAKMCEIGPRFLADVAAAKAKANGAPMDMRVDSRTVDGADSAVDAASVN